MGRGIAAAGSGAVRVGHGDGHVVEREDGHGGSGVAWQGGDVLDGAERPSSGADDRRGHAHGAFGGLLGHPSAPPRPRLDRIAGCHARTVDVARLRAGAAVGCRRHARLAYRLAGAGTGALSVRDPAVGGERVAVSAAGCDGHAAGVELRYRLRIRDGLGRLAVDGARGRRHIAGRGVARGGEPSENGRCSPSCSCLDHVRRGVGLAGGRSAERAEDIDGADVGAGHVFVHVAAGVRQHDRDAAVHRVRLPCRSGRAVGDGAHVDGGGASSLAGVAHRMPAGSGQGVRVLVHHHSLGRRIDAAHVI